MSKIMKPKLTAAVWALDQFGDAREELFRTKGTGFRRTQNGRNDFHGSVRIYWAGFEDMGGDTCATLNAEFMGVTKEDTIFYPRLEIIGYCTKIGVVDKPQIQQHDYYKYVPDYQSGWLPQWIRIDVRPIDE
jgi:hypothetical protein